MVEQLRAIDPLQAARARLQLPKKKKFDPPRRISCRRKYRLHHPDLFRKIEKP